MEIAHQISKPLIYKKIPSINSHHSAIFENTTDGLIFRHLQKLMDCPSSSSRLSFSLFFLVNKEIEKKMGENSENLKDGQNHQTDGTKPANDGKNNPNDGQKHYKNQTLNQYSRLNPSIHAATCLTLYARSARPKKTGLSRLMVEAQDPRPAPAFNGARGAVTAAAVLVKGCGETKRAHAAPWGFVEAPLPRREVWM